MSKTSSSPSGIGGWLILPLIGLAMSLILTSVNIWAFLKELSFDSWLTILRNYPLFGLYLSFSLLSGLVAIALNVRLFHLVFTYDARTPRWFIFYLAYIATVNLIEYAGLAYSARLFDDPSFLEGEPRATLQSLMAAAIWIPYFRQSLRVKNTFPRGGTAPVDKIFT